MLVHIDPRHLDTVWPQVGPVLARAVAVNDGECDLAQLRMQIAHGGAQLLVYEEDALTAGVVEFKQYANYRVAFFSYLAGRTSPDAWQAFRQWARAQGASRVECCCRPAQARLFQRYGMQAVYRLLRDDLQEDDMKEARK